MATNQYNIKTSARKARPRSKRLRSLGLSASAILKSATVAIAAEAASGSDDSWKTLLERDGDDGNIRLLLAADVKDQLRLYCLVEAIDATTGETKSTYLSISGLQVVEETDTTGEVTGRHLMVGDASYPLHLQGEGGIYFDSDIFITRNMDSDESTLELLNLSQLIRNTNLINVGTDEDPVWAIGGGIDLITLNDYATEPSDTNTYSSLRLIEEFVSRLNDDTVASILTYLQGAKFGNYVAGSSGGAIYKDSDGAWHIEGDYFHVRKKLEVEVIQVQRTTHIGGKVMNTPASMICTKVETYDTYYRCFFKTADDDGQVIYNQFAADDQALCQTFNLSTQANGLAGNHLYWRLVLSIGSNYIDLSISDCAASSDAPVAGDHIVQLGNRSDTSRQNAIIEASAGTGAPFLRIYKGISSYVLPTPRIDLNPTESKIYAKIYNEASGDNYDDIIAGINTRIDGIDVGDDQQYTIWFDSYIPTLENEPYTLWSTGALKELHVGDVFYNRSVDAAAGGGRAYMFTKTVNADGITYSWERITDSDTLAALESAASAQSTANGKRRVFVAQPLDSAVYDVGDLWVNAVWDNGDGTYIYNDELLVCQVSKSVGEVFSIEHWAPSSSITRAFITNFGNEILLGVAEDIQTVHDAADAANALATAAQTRANSAYSYANSAYNRAGTAITNASSALSAAQAAQSAADAAQADASQALNDGATYASAIVTLNNSVTAVAAKFNSSGQLADTSYLVLSSDFAAFQTAHFASDGSLVNTTGLVLSADFAAFQSEKFNADGSLANTAGLVLASGTGTTSFATMFAAAGSAAGYIDITAVEDYFSTITITADKINLAGYTSINTFQIASNGTMYADNAVIANSYLDDCVVRGALTVGKDSSGNGDVIIAESFTVSGYATSLLNSSGTALTAQGLSLFYGAVSIQAALRIKSTFVTNNRTLANTDSPIIICNNTSNITITLPSSPTIYQCFLIKKRTTQVTISGNGNSIYTNGANSSITLGSDYDGHACLLFYTAYGWEAFRLTKP